MKCRSVLVAVVILAAILVSAVLWLKPSPTDVVEFRILRHTNDGSGLQALVQMTNSYRNLRWYIHTEYQTNGTWLRSASEPPYDSYSPTLPAKTPHMNVWIPVPTEAETWRVDLEVRPYERGKVAQALGRFCRAVGVRDIFYPEAKSIKSQAFEK